MAAVQDELAELRTQMASSNQQLAALIGQLSTLTDEVAVLARRDSDHDGTLEELASRIDALDAASARHVEVLDEHARRLSGLDDAMLDRVGEMARLGVDMDGLQRQTAIDIREMRGNYAGLAETMLRQRVATAPDREAGEQIGTRTHR